MAAIWYNDSWSEKNNTYNVEVDRVLSHRTIVRIYDFFNCPTKRGVRRINYHKPVLVGKNNIKKERIFWWKQKETQQLQTQVTTTWYISDDQSIINSTDTQY